MASLLNHKSEKKVFFSACRIDNGERIGCRLVLEQWFSDWTREESVVTLNEESDAQQKLTINPENHPNHLARPS